MRGALDGVVHIYAGLERVAGRQKAILSAQRSCLACGSSFQPSAYGCASFKLSRKCCSEECARAYIRTYAKNYYKLKPPKPSRTCQQCGAIFTPKARATHQVCCSKQCRRKKNKQPANKSASAAWRLKNREKLRTARKEKRQKPGVKVYRNWYKAVTFGKTYTGTLEEWAHYRERAAIEITPHKLKQMTPKKPAKRSPTYGMTDAEEYKYWYDNDPVFQAWERQRNQFNRWRKGERSSNTLSRLLGYSRDDLAQHLESQFHSGMSWDNIGQWHIDHIIPKNLFDPNDIEQVRGCWALSNLRPLWARDNLRRPKDGRDVRRAISAECVSVCL